MIRWFAKNDIASNFLLVAILLGGIYTALNKIPLEVRPSMDFGEVDIKMTYRGGSPKDVEEHILIPIERALRDVDGIKRLESRATRGLANFDIMGEDGVDLDELRDEVEAAVETINTFPGETERPRISVPRMSNYKEVVTLAVIGDLSNIELYKLTRRIENDILELPEISRTSLRGIHDLQIAIEANDEKLRDHGLSLQDLSDAIRRSSMSLSAGSVRTPSGSIMIRTDGQAYNRNDFANIIITADDGAQLRLSDLANITDGFEEENHILRFNGERALFIDILQGSDESAIKISDAVKNYIAQSVSRFPEGIKLETWDDESIRIRGRLSTLANSLLMGGLLVFIVLGIFLRPMLAFWVVVGIPVSFAGGALFMPYFGLSANTMSLFGFIIVLGIVVDDAIITGENVYSRLRDDLTPLDAAVLGTKEVATPVTFGAITTIVAFLPLMFFEGFWQAWTSQIPPIVGAVLIFSLIESKLILPSHLKHMRVHRDTRKLGHFSRFQKAIADGLERAVERYYQPALKFAVNHRYTTLSLFFALAFITLGIQKGGKIGFVPMPTIERYIINSHLDMLPNTPFEETNEAVLYIAAKARELQAELIDPGNGRSLVKNIMEESGDTGHHNMGSDPEEGSVAIEILPPSERTVPGPTNEEIIKLWRDRVGKIPGSRSFHVRGSYGSRRHGGQETEAIQIQLRGEGSEEKYAIAEEIEELFESHPLIEWAHADHESQREELAIIMKPLGIESGLTQRDLASQIRQAFYGDEVQRIQRDGEELRVIVRLPESKRESLHTFDTLNIQTPSGDNIPFTTVASAELRPAPGSIEREDRAQINRITASPESKETDIVALANELEPQISAIVNRNPEFSWVWDGYIKEDRETGNRFYWLYGGLILVLYALLAIPFRSLLQPLVVLLAIPFGMIGAYGGHIIMGVIPSWLSVFGIMALAGVVVNDSLVLVDFINRKREEGMDLLEAVMISGVKRFRPIFLTSITTFAGLIPLMFDRALHAQFLKPMAISLGYGILFATVITLFLIPAAYLILEDAKRLFGAGFRWYSKPFNVASTLDSKEKDKFNKS
ncbi:MAG: efflux RND transporter permease subunit [Verrucomicrobiaceae bacterium]